MWKRICPVCRATDWEEYDEWDEGDGGDCGNPDCEHEFCYRPHGDN